MWRAIRAGRALTLLAVAACARGATRREPAAVAPEGAVRVTGAASAAAPRASAPSLASDAVAESLLVDVRQVDSTVRVDVRYATPGNFTGAVLPGYAAPRVLLRREAAAALARAQARLRASGLGLLVYDGYRPARATAAMVAWARGVHREELLRDGYIAERSRHNLGLAVDCTLVALATGRPLEMGTAFDTFAPAAHTANATGDVAVNRRRLVRAMADAGFVNLAEEWWHFSYDVPDPVRFDLVIR